MGTPEVLINIMLCHCFSKVIESTLTITCYSALVPYYLSKGFIIVEKVDGVFVNITDPFLNNTDDSPLHDEYSLLPCKYAMPLIVKTLNKIVIKNIFIENCSLVGMVQ